MRIGLISDQHLGYSRGTRDTEDGVNVREQDVLDAAQAGVDNLVSAGVDCIVDLGDIAHVPAPKKRAVLAMVNMINNSGVPWYSANGNHTLQRTRSDLHLYDVLGDLCSRFQGFVEPNYIPQIGAYLIPYGTEVEALKAVPADTKFVGGHFAADDVPFPGEHVSVKDLPAIPVFLGHYHTRKMDITMGLDGAPMVDYALKSEFVSPTLDVSYDGPVYIGATERFAWGECDNPTGVAVFNTENQYTYFIEHPTREWLDIISGADAVLKELKAIDLTEKIVRVTVEATVPEYHALPIKDIRELSRSALEFQIRRKGSEEEVLTLDRDTQTYSLMEAWNQHIMISKYAPTTKKFVVDIGMKALSVAGVLE